MLSRLCYYWKVKSHSWLSLCLFVGLVGFVLVMIRSWPWPWSGGTVEGGLITAGAAGPSSTTSTLELPDIFFYFQKWFLDFFSTVIKNKVSTLQLWATAGSSSPHSKQAEPFLSQEQEAVLIMSHLVRLKLFLAVPRASWQAHSCAAFMSFSCSFFNTCPDCWRSNRKYRISLCIWAATFYLTENQCKLCNINTEDIYYYRKVQMPHKWEIKMLLYKAAN